MAIDIKECTLNRMVFAARDVNSNQLMVDSVDGPVHPTFSLTPNIIIKKGDIGFVRSEYHYSSPFSSIKKVSVSYGSFTYWMDPEWLSLKSPTFALTPDIEKLVNHIRQLENQIQSFDDTDRITSLINEVSTLNEHIEDLDLEKNVYIDAFAKMDIDPLTANGIARGNICPRCLESMATHYGDGSCVENDNPEAYADDGTSWKDLYLTDLWARYEDAVKINEFGDGQDEWDWGDIEEVVASELHRRGIGIDEIQDYRKIILREEGYEDDDDQEDDEQDLEDKQVSLSDKILRTDTSIFDDDDASEDDIKLDPEIY